MEKYPRFLEQTRVRFRQVQNILQSHETLSDELWESVEKELLSADVGPQASRLIKEKLQRLAEMGRISSGEETYVALRQELLCLLGKPSALCSSRSSSLTVMMVMGNHSSGVTTTAAKLTSYLHRVGRTVLLISKDLVHTREQDRLKTQVQQSGVLAKWPDDETDFVHVVDTHLQPPLLQGFDVVLIDASVCLTKDNKGLEELHNAIDTIQEMILNTLIELLGVFDANSGQQEVPHFRHMATYTGLTGAILSKVDISAKGGCIFAIADDLGIPIKFLGTGKEIEHLILLDPADFVAALFE